MNRLVLASLNQGARLLGVLERRCRNHLLQRTDVRAGAVQRDADFPDGPYDSRYDYGLTDFEEENELLEPIAADAPCECSCIVCLLGEHCDRASCALPDDGPQEMPDELWPRPCVTCDHGEKSHLEGHGCLAGDCRCDGYRVARKPAIYPTAWTTHLLPSMHKGREWIGHAGWRYTFDPEGDGWLGVRAGLDDIYLRPELDTSNYGPFTEAPHSSAPVPRAVVAGASPGGATHPAPPGERETRKPRVIGWLDETARGTEWLDSRGRTWRWYGVESWGCTDPETGRTTSGFSERLMHDHPRGYGEPFTEIVVAKPTWEIRRSNAFQAVCNACGNHATGLFPTEHRARQAVEEKGGHRCPCASSTLSTKPVVQGRAE